MLHIDRILFPTDGSKSAEFARRHATFLADRHGATLHVVHVEEREPDWSDVIEVTETDVLADLNVDVTELDGSPSQVVQHSLAHPSAAGGILSYAAEHDIDLIVMGTHGRRGVRRLFMGSVAEEVVRRSECPVLTVVAPEHEVQPKSAVERILVPIDFSDHTDLLLDHVREIAHAYDSGIDLVHVVEPVSLPTAYGNAPLKVDADEIKEDARQVLDDYCDALRTEGLDVLGHLRVGHPADEVLTVAESHGADLVCIATHGRTGVERLLMGSVAEKVVRMAPSPVFTVKSYGRSLVDRPAMDSEVKEQS